MKVLLLAFGNPDNVLSLSRHLSEKVDLTVVFSVSGDRFRQGVMDADLTGLDNGLITERSVVDSVLNPDVKKYIGGCFSLWFLKTPSRKFIHKSGGFKNYLIVRKAARELSACKFDAVHFNGTSGFLLYLLKHINCKNRIWTLHDYKPHTGEETRFGKLLNSVYTKFGIRYIQHYEYLKKEFAAYFSLNPELIDQVYSGAFDIYESIKAKPTEVPGRYVLFFGRFSKYKGLDLLFRSFMQINDGSLCLIAAGDGNADGITAEDNRIKLINRYIPPDELAYLIDRSLCVITPYSDSTHSGVIMTAYAFNKPVISSDVGGIKEVLIDGKTGLLFRAGDEKGLISAIEKMADDTELRKRMSENIGLLKKEGILNWDSITTKMTAIYSKTAQ